MTEDEEGAEFDAAVEDLYAFLRVMLSRYGARACSFALMTATAETALKTTGSPERAQALLSEAYSAEYLQALSDDLDMLRNHVQ